MRYAARWATAGALLLLASMFALRWYGVAGAAGPIAPRLPRHAAESAWQALSISRWVLLAAVAVVLAASAPLLAGRPRKPSVKRMAAWAVVLSGTTAGGLLIWRVFISLPGDGRLVDQKLGAVLAALAGVIIAGAGADLLRASVRSAR